MESEGGGEVQGEGGGGCRVRSEGWRVAWEKGQC